MNTVAVPPYPPHARLGVGADASFANVPYERSRGRLAGDALLQAREEGVNPPGRGGRYVAMGGCKRHVEGSCDQFIHPINVLTPSRFSVRPTLIFRVS